jgi:hypothetical protein
MKIYDTPKKSTSLHTGRVEYVFETGMLNVRSERDGSLFEGVNVMYSGTDVSYYAGDSCVLMTDGVMHIVMGKINKPTRDVAGNTTIKNLNNDLSDIEGIQSMVSTDAIGNQMSVSVSPALGVLLDGGGSCISHYDPYKSKIFSMSERYECITTPMSIDLDHDGATCTAKIKFRSVSDPESINRDFEYDSDDSKDYGFSSVLMMNSDGLSINNYNDGIKKSSVVINKDGTIQVESVSSISFNSTDDVNINAGAASMVLKSNGKVRIENAAVELLSLIDNVMLQLQNSQTLTFYGPQPLLPASASMVALRVQLGLLKD